MLIGKYRNFLIYALWIFVVGYSLVFNNFTSWTVLFFFTGLLIFSLVSLHLKVKFDTAHIPKHIRVHKSEMIVFTIQPTRHTRFHVLRVKPILVSDGRRIEGIWTVSFMNDTVDFSIETSSIPRGQYENVTVDFIISDIFGVLERTLESITIASITVMPQENSRADEVLDFIQHKTNFLTKYSSLETFDLRTIRDYIPGDKLNHIDWKLSTRSQSLKYREFHHEVDTPSVFIMSMQEHEAVEWMLSLFMTLDVKAFSKGFGTRTLLGNPVFINPKLDKYAYVAAIPYPSLHAQPKQLIIFTPTRRHDVSSHCAQFYFEETSLIFENNGKRHLILTVDKGDFVC